MYGEGVPSLAVRTHPECNKSSIATVLLAGVFRRAATDYSQTVQLPDRHQKSRAGTLAGAHLTRTKWKQGWMTLLFESCRFTLSRYEALEHRHRGTSPDSAASAPCRIVCQSQ